MEFEILGGIIFTCVKIWIAYLNVDVVGNTYLSVDVVKYE